MNTLIATKDAEAWAGGTVALAKLLGISHNAVSQWGINVPEKRAYQLRLARPYWFFKHGGIKPHKATAA